MKQLQIINQYLTPFNLGQATQFLDDCYDKCLTYEEVHQLLDIILEKSVLDNNLGPLKLFKHVVFNSITSDTLKRSIVFEVIRSQNFEFIVPSVLACSTTINHYTAVMFDLLDTSLANYIYEHPVLNFDEDYVEEHYATLFQKNAITLINILKDCVSPNDILIKNCFLQALCASDGQALHYLHNHYPKEFGQVIDSWHHYISSSREYHPYDECHLLSQAKKSSHIRFTAQTLSTAFNLMTDTVHVKYEEKIMSYMLNSLLRQNNQAQAIYDFLALTHHSQNKIVSETIFEQIINWQNENREFHFKDFKIFYEQTKLEQLNLSIQATSRKQKI